MEVLTGDEYIALLAERRDEWEVEHPARSHSWARPLLEWFIESGDEHLFNPPTRVAAPQREARPRKYRTAESLRAERDRLQARADRLAEPILPDRAAAGGVGLGPRRTARVHDRMDRQLRKYVELAGRIAALDGRITRAEIREARND